MTVIQRAKILPTGNEIADGTVIDTNSPAIMELLLQDSPCCEVLRLPPVCDEKDTLKAAVKAALRDQPDLLFTIGGTGGGRRFVAGLAPDFTAACLEEMLSEHDEVDLYGYNGHLWSKIIAGTWGKTRVIALPGPYTEAVAGAKAAIQAVNAGADNKLAASRIAEAVCKEYPRPR